MLKSIALNRYTTLSINSVGQYSKGPLKHDLVAPSSNMMNICSSFEYTYKSLTVISTFLSARCRTN